MRVKEIKHGSILIQEGADLKEFYILSQGALQFVPASRQVDIPVIGAVTNPAEENGAPLAEATAGRSPQSGRTPRREE